MENNIISFIDSDGNKVEYEILGIEYYQDKIYFVCYLKDRSSTEIFIYRVESLNDDKHDECVFEEDEKIRLAVFEMFKKRNKDKYEFLI